MMKYEFYHGADLLSLAEADRLPISEIMLRSEAERTERSREEILAQLAENLEVMKTSVRKGMDVLHPAHGVFCGGDACRMMEHAGESLMGETMARAVAAAMAVVEFNASMGKIVAAPTAGASGILPAALLTIGEKRGFRDEELIRGLLTAGAVGTIIARNASIAGASGGCQAETGSGAAMAAAALAELCGATPETCLHAAAMALKNCMGLVCDPVGGLVECPCIKRNAIGVTNAILSCDLALAGITSLIPFDEVVDAMRSVGNMMSNDLKETARGGVAVTPTGMRIAKLSVTSGFQGNF